MALGCPCMSLSLCRLFLERDRSAPSGATSADRRIGPASCVTVRVLRETVVIRRDKKVYANSQSLNRSISHGSWTQPSCTSKNSANLPLPLSLSLWCFHFSCLSQETTTTDRDDNKTATKDDEAQTTHWTRRNAHNKSKGVTTRQELRRGKKEGRPNRGRENIMDFLTFANAFTTGKKEMQREEV